MNVTREDLNPCTVKLSIVCEPAEVKDGFDKAFKAITKKVRLPGFRPGHAPKKMLEQFVDQRELYNEATDIIVRKLVTKAINDEQLQPDRSQLPSVELKKIEQESDECEFDVKVPLPPVVELGEYKGLPVDKPSVEVSDDEVSYQLDEIRKRRSTRESITDRGVEEGDVAVVNLKADGVEGEGQTFMTVVGQTFPALDEVLKGMRVEEMKHVDLEFPDTFQEKDWAGKTMKVTVTLNSLSAVQLPPVDEEFAKSLQTDNVDDLKTKLKETISHAKEEMMREIVNEQLLDALLERSTVHVSDNMWEALANRRLQETAQEQGQKGKSMEEYAKDNGMTVEELVQAWQDKAKIHVRRALLIREVFTKEKMQLSNSELNKELFSMAEEYEMQPEELLNLLKKNNQVEELHFRSIARKVGDFLSQNSEQKEPVTA